MDAMAFAAITNFARSLRDKVVCDRFETLQRNGLNIIHDNEAIALNPFLSLALLFVHSWPDYPTHLFWCNDNHPFRFKARF